MEIHSLELVVTEEDINQLLRRHLPPDQPIEDLRLNIDSRGLVVSGTYPLFLQVRFETLWSLRVEQGKVAAELADFRALGVPANIFKSAIVKIIEDLTREEPWIRRQDDTLFLDVDQAVARHVVPGRTNLQRIECRPGHIIFVAART